jgi:CheY-like chemotaxis protein
MSLKLLIVDDSKVCLVLIRGYVQEFRPDWICTTADNAEDAMRLIEQQQFDVFSLDYNLPGRNGLELARWIRSTNKRSFIGLLTSNILNHIEAQAESDQISYYRKPPAQHVIQQFVSDAERYIQD